MMCSRFTAGWFIWTSSLVACSTVATAQNLDRFILGAHQTGKFSNAKAIGLDLNYVYDIQPDYQYDSCALPHYKPYYQEFLADASADSTILTGSSHFHIQDYATAPAMEFWPVHQDEYPQFNFTYTWYYRASSYIHTVLERPRESPRLIIQIDTTGPTNPNYA